MRILFTTSNKIGSRIIQAVTGEPVSHCAIQIGERIYHSTLSRIRNDWYGEFITDHTIVYSVDIPNDSNVISLHLPTPHRGITYDIGGFLYLGLRCLIPWLPKKNLWQETGMYLCTEYVTSVLWGEEDSMLTPYKLYQRLTKGN